MLLILIFKSHLFICRLKKRSPDWTVNCQPQIQWNHIFCLIFVQSIVNTAEFSFQAINGLVFQEWKKRFSEKPKKKVQVIKGYTRVSRSKFEGVTPIRVASRHYEAKMLISGAHHRCRSRCCWRPYEMDRWTICSMVILWWRLRPLES